jgi:hypothetical protein
LERQLIDHRNQAPGGIQPRKILKVYAVLGVLAVLVIAALLYELGKVHNEANRRAAPAAPKSTQLDNSNEQSGDKPKLNDREATNAKNASSGSL